MNNIINDIQKEYENIRPHAPWTLLKLIKNYLIINCIYCTSKQIENIYNKCKYNNLNSFNNMDKNILNKKFINISLASE